MNEGAIFAGQRDAALIAATPAQGGHAAFCETHDVVGTHREIIRTAAPQLALLLGECLQRADP
jgi:hypothetical protein